MNKIFQHALAACALLTCVGAQAQVADHLMVRIGAVKVKPIVQSGDLSAPAFTGSQVDVTSSTVPSGGITYMLDDHWAVDMPVATPLKHDIVGSGSVAGVGKLGETRALPITLLGQYRFGESHDTFRPYLGAGITYALFYKERGTNTLNALSGGTPTSPTTLAIDNRFGPSVQLGATMALNERWFLDATVIKTWVKTTARLSRGQTLDLRLDPVAVAVGIGYRY
jgi:outer membrane protein